MVKTELEAAPRDPDLRTSSVVHTPQDGEAFTLMIATTDAAALVVRDLGDDQASQPPVDQAGRGSGCSG